MSEVTIYQNIDSETWLMNRGRNWVRVVEWEADLIETVSKPQCLPTDLEENQKWDKRNAYNSPAHPGGVAGLGYLGNLGQHS